MNNFKILSISLVALMLFAFKVDDTPLEKLLKQLAKITETYPQEKVHLHTDKPYYAVGEDIWIKGYVVTAEKNEPSQLSKVLYVDLIDQNNNIRQNLTLKLTNGTTHGSLKITDSLKSGTYRLRAYTNYMRNYDGRFFFEKQISIGNVMETTSSQLADNKKKEKMDVQFFPEGGNLVKGIRSKVGVKAVLQNGLGANLKGYIINEKKEKVAEFSTTHAGMGIFALLPTTTGTYKAIVKNEDGTDQSFNLPDVLTTGHSLGVNNDGENFVVRISSSPELIGDKEVLVIAQTNGVVYASFKAKIEQPTIIANIPKKNFPTGITQITLFTAEGKPIAERLVFVNREDALTMELSVKNAPTVKGKSELSLSVKDFAAREIDGNFSVAVVDATKVPVNEDEETTILSNLLLTSELKGYVEKPNYYFNTANENRERDLDNLLLTQGWRRFSWDDVLAAKEPEIKFRPEQTLEITGSITGQYGKPLPKASVSLISTTPGLLLKIDTVSDSKGNFIFDRLDIPDSSSFFVQSKLGKNNKDIRIKLTPPPEVMPYQKFGNTVDIASYLQNTKEQFQELTKYNMLNGDRILLKTVDIQQKKVLKPLINVPNSANASGVADFIITEKMLEGSINMLSPFYRVSGVVVRNGALYNVRGRNSIMNSPPPYNIILDGMRVNQDILQSINPSDVAGIEVLSSGYNTAVYGEDGAGGVIYITTKRGPGKGPGSTNIARIINAGFSTVREFYVPNYEDPKINKQMLDLRSTIYWNPNVITNQKGQATFNFFNASTAGEYRVTVEGMDPFGNIGRKVFKYEVK